MIEKYTDLIADEVKKSGIISNLLKGVQKHWIISILVALFVFFVYMLFSADIDEDDYDDDISYEVECLD